MRRRHPPIPAIWLMTDERMSERLWRALDRLPRGGGVIVRHYGLAASARRELIRRVAKVARKRGLTLVIAGGDPAFPAAGAHNRRHSRAPLRTASAHSRREAIAAVRSGAHAVFASPVFATRSHPGAKALGPVRFGLMIQGLGVPVIALGGMTAKRARHLQRLGSSGWAAIDAWLD